MGVLRSFNFVQVRWWIGWELRYCSLIVRVRSGAGKKNSSFDTVNSWRRNRKVEGSGTTVRRGIRGKI